MIDDIKQNCPNWTNTDLLKDYLMKILRKEAYNGEGLIYGMGHAVYTLSDPRAELLKEKALELALEKDAVDEFNLYLNIERLTIEIFKELKGPDFVISANLDLYSGFVYEMLGLPEDLYTPSSPPPASPAGAPTASSRSSPTTRSCARPTSV